MALIHQHGPAPFGVGKSQAVFPAVSIRIKKFDFEWANIRNVHEHIIQFVMMLAQGFTGPDHLVPYPHFIIFEEDSGGNRP